MKIDTRITVAGKVIGTERISEEFSKGVENYNFKDMEEVNQILYAIYRCERKNIFDWCPADTKYLKNMLGIA